MLLSFLVSLHVQSRTEPFGRRQGAFVRLGEVEEEGLSRSKTPSVLVIQSDNRVPEEILGGKKRRGEIKPHSGAKFSAEQAVQQYWSLSLELNLAYCCERNYDLTYYRLVDTWDLPKDRLPISVTGTVTTVASCVQIGLGAREPSYCKLPAVADALTQKHDYVVFIDSDAFLNDGQVDIPSILSSAKPLEADADDSKIGLFFAYNFPWNEDKPNGGFFIFKQTSAELREINDDILKHWWHHDETSHNGIFEQHSIWALLDGTAPWIRKHVALLPLKAMTAQATGLSPLTHFESSQKQNRVPKMTAALLAKENTGSKCTKTKARVIEFNATEAARSLLKMTKPHYAWSNERFQKTWSNEAT